jgi:hypothetical protein
MLKPPGKLVFRLSSNAITLDRSGGTLSWPTKFNRPDTRVMVADTVPIDFIRHAIGRITLTLFDGVTYSQIVQVVNATGAEEAARWIEVALLQFAFRPGMRWFESDPVLAHLLPSGAMVTYHEEGAEITWPCLTTAPVGQLPDELFAGWLHSIQYRGGGRLIMSFTLPETAWIREFLAATGTQEVAEHIDAILATFGLKVPATSSSATSEPSPAAAV